MKKEQSLWGRFRESVKKTLESTPEPPTPVEERTHRYLPVMQSALTAYFNVHALDKDIELPEGLCIPFCPVENLSKTVNWNNGYDRAKESAALRVGTLVSTGGRTKAGHHIFRARLTSTAQYGGGFETKTLPVPFLPDSPS